MSLARGLPVVILSAIVATNVAVLTPMLSAAEATGCSGSATTFDESGAPLDTATTAEGATSGDPLDLTWTGVLQWEGTTDAVLQDGTWSVDVAPRGAGPLYEYTLGLLIGQFLSGDFTNAEGKQSSSGEVEPSDLTGTTRMVTGTYEVNWDISAAAGSCTGTAYITITDNPFGTVAWWTSVILILIGIIGVIMARPPALPPLGPGGPGGPPTTGTTAGGQPPTQPPGQPPTQTATQPPVQPAQPPGQPPQPVQPPAQPPVQPVQPPAQPPTPPPVPPSGEVPPPPPPPPPSGTTPVTPPAQPPGTPPAQPQAGDESTAQRRRTVREAQRRGRHPVRGGLMGLLLGLGVELMLVLYSIPIPLGIAMIGCIVLGILFGMWRRRRDEEEEPTGTAPAPA